MTTRFLLVLHGRSSLMDLPTELRFFRITVKTSLFFTQIKIYLDNTISFNFKAFAFQDFNPNGPPVFGEEIKIQCTVCVCDQNLDQNCVPGARRRRSIGDETKEFVVNSSFKLN